MTPVDVPPQDAKQRHAQGPLTDSVAIVTGAGGIGRATGGALRRRGAHVVLVDREPSSATAAEKQVRELAETSAEVVGLALDVRSPQDMSAMADQVIDSFGRIDILVTAAGVLRAPGVPRPVHRTGVDEWNLVVETNLTGVYLSNRAVLPSMLRRRAGQIVNVASVSGQEAQALDAAYCASKFGVVGLSEAVMKETAPYGVRVNVILPGAVDTPLWQQNGGLTAPADALPPERVAETIAYLLCLPSDTLLWKPVIVPSGQATRSAGWRRRARARAT